MGASGRGRLARGEGGAGRRRARHPGLGDVRPGRPGYDYWHVRQALADSKLKYVVVGDDELKAPSRRGATLRAVLAYAGKPVAEFPGRKDGRGTPVKVFEVTPPESWEGVQP